MRVYNLSDAHEHPRCPWHTAKDVVYGEIRIPSGKSAELTDEEAETLRSAYADKLGYGERPDWYKDLKAPKKKAKKTPKKK